MGARAKEGGWKVDTHEKCSTALARALGARSIATEMSRRSQAAAPLSVVMVLALWACSGVQRARSDFGDALMYEAVDLAEAHPPDQEADVRSMESLLHWAIAHSNPEELSQRAESARHEEVLQELSRQLEERRARVKELKGFMDAQVTETQLIKEALAVLVQANATAAELLAALQDLQPLVEPIDNANDLKPLGGIAPLVRLLFSGRDSEPSAARPSDPASPGSGSADAAGLRTAAAFVIGTAASNNVRFQSDLMEAAPNIFERLIELSQDPEEEVAVKGMYALAAMVRNQQQAQAAFATAGGYRALERLMLDDAVSARVKRKVVALVMDLSQAETHHDAASPPPQARLASNPGLLSAVLALLGTRDPDAVEKALEALRTLLQGPQREAAAQHLRAAAAATKLSALEDQLHEAQAQDDDMYGAYLLELCRTVRQLLEPGMGAQQQAAGSGSQPESRQQAGASAEGHSGSAKDGEAGAERILQLGHVEL